VIYGRVLRRENRLAETGKFFHHYASGVHSDGAFLIPHRTSVWQFKGTFVSRDDAADYHCRFAESASLACESLRECSFPDRIHIIETRCSSFPCYSSLTTIHLRRRSLAAEIIESRTARSSARVIRAACESETSEQSAHCGKLMENLVLGPQNFADGRNIGRSNND
jgi:hypothetical protein